MSLPSPMFFVTIINLGLMLFVVFSQRRNTAATWAWLVACALFPIGGFILYMLGGQDRLKQRVFQLKTKEDQELLAEYEALLVGAVEGQLTHDNTIELFHDGVTKFDALLDDIKHAKKSIFAQYYILRGDETGRRFMNALTERAAEGIEVRLLIDGMGCHYTSANTWDPFLKAGGLLGVFLPPVPVRVNFRNHRKYVIVDGELAYLGGSNIGDEYMGMTERHGHWRDTHMRYIGKAVAPVMLRFIMDWNCDATKTPDKISLKHDYFPKPLTYADAVAHTELVESTGIYEAPRLHNNAMIKLLSSGPDTRYPNVLHEFNDLIMHAKKSIYIQSPYFVPDESMFICLRIAALRGVDVRIMYPGNPDHPFVYWVASSFVGELLEAGVKGYEYTKGFIHCKTMMVDGKISAVGTANMDVRSFKINFETHAFIEDESITQELIKEFYKDMEDCKEIHLTEYEQRSRMTKIKESVSRLFSPLL